MFNLVGLTFLLRPPKTHTSNLWGNYKSFYSSSCSILGFDILALLKYGSVEILLNNIFCNSFSHERE